MPIYKVKLKSRQEIAAGTMAFNFEKPEGFAYNAGQFADYTLSAPAETDAEGNTRGFSPRKHSLRRRFYACDTDA